MDWLVGGLVLSWIASLTFFALWRIAVARLLHARLWLDVYQSRLDHYRTTMPLEGQSVCFSSEGGFRILEELENGNVCTPGGSGTEGTEGRS